MYSVDEEDDSSDLVSLFWLKGWKIKEEFEVWNEGLVFKDEWRSEVAFSKCEVFFKDESSFKGVEC